MTNPAKTFRWLTAVLAVALFTALNLPSSAASAVETRPDLPSLSIGAHGHRYELSRPSLPAGPVRVTYTNHGPQVHALQTARADPGRSEAEFREVLAGFLDGTITQSPTWLHADVPFAFGPTSSGRTVTAAISLSDPGLYVVFDLLTDSTGTTFAEQGMVASFTVRGAPRSGPLPNADAVITGTDVEFRVPRLTAGGLTLKLRNIAQVERQFAIIALRRGKTLDDLREWLMGGQVGAPPGDFVANVLPLAPGASLLIELRLDPGRYLLVDDGETEAGVPYTEFGLLTRFYVARAHA